MSTHFVYAVRTIDGNKGPLVQFQVGPDWKNLVTCNVVPAAARDIALSLQRFADRADDGGAS